MTGKKEGQVTDRKRKLGGREGGVNEKAFRGQEFAPIRVHVVPSCLC